MNETIKNKSLITTVLISVACLILIAVAAVLVTAGQPQTVNAETVTESTLTEEEFAMSIGLHGDAVGGDHVHEGAKELPTTDAEMSGGMYYLAQDTVVTEILNIDAGEEVALCLNGHKLSKESVKSYLFSVNGGGSLIIYDCEGGGSMTNTGYTCIYVNSGSLTMNGGVICDSGLIGKDNQVIGGGIYVSDGGTFTMNGGVIKNNKAESGGGICGDVTINGGIISGNSASSSGGGIRGDVTINGGIISGNSASSGGGICGGATMNGGIISGNSTSGSGGGIYVTYMSTLTINKGTISGNTSYDYGGGVFLASEATLNAGGTAVIQGNYHSQNRSNVLINHENSKSKIYITAPIEEGFDIGIRPRYLSHKGIMTSGYKSIGLIDPTAKVCMTSDIDSSILVASQSGDELELLAANIWTGPLETGAYVHGSDFPAPIASSKYGKVEYSYSDSEDGEFVAEQPTEIGVYWVKAYVPRTDTYTGLEAIVRYEITRQVNTWTAKLATGAYVYGSEVISPTGAAATYGEVEYSYSDTENGEFVAKPPTNVGVHWIKAYVPRTEEYSGLEAKVRYEILPKTLTNSMVGQVDGTFTYSGIQQKPTVTVSDGDLLTTDDYTVEYGENKELGEGTVTVTAKGNYSGVITRKFKITPAAIEVSVTGYNGIYDGNEHDASESQTAITQGDQPVSWTYATTQNGDYTDQMPQYTEAGRYTVYYKVSAPSHNEVSGSYEVTIMPEEIDVSVYGYEGTYDGEPHEAIAQCSAETVFHAATWTYAESANEDYTEVMPQYRNAGTYTVYYKVSAQSHEDAYGTFTVTIAKRNVTVTIGHKTGVYGEELKELTYALEDGALASGDNAEVLNIKLTKATGLDAGTYAITGGYYSANYAVEFIDGTYTIEKATYETTDLTFDGKTVTYNGQLHSLAVTGLPAGVEVTYTNNGKINAGTYEVTATFKGDANYNDIADMTATLTIEKATYVTTDLTFEGETVTYNGQLHSLEVTGLPAGVEVNYTNNGKIKAGTYEVTATFKGDANYNDIADMTATLTIKKAVYNMSGVTFGNKTIQADGNAQSVTISGTLPDGVTVTYVGNGKTEAGEYTVTAKFGGDAENYEAIPDKTAKLTITPAPEPEPEPEPEKGGCGGVVLDGMTVAGITLAVLAIAVALAVRKAKNRK